VIERVFNSGNANSPEEAVLHWSRTFQKRLEGAQGDNHRLQYDLALESFEEVLDHYNSKPPCTKVQGFI